MRLLTIQWLRGGPNATRKRNRVKENVRNIKHGNKGFDELRPVQNISATSHYACGNLVVKRLKIVCDSRKPMRPLRSPKIEAFVERKNKKKISKSDNNLMKFFWVFSRLNPIFNRNEKTWGRQRTQQRDTMDFSVRDSVGEEEEDASWIMLAHAVFGEFKAELKNYAEILKFGEFLLFGFRKYCCRFCALK